MKIDNPTMLQKSFNTQNYKIKVYNFLRFRVCLGYFKLSHHYICVDKGQSWGFRSHSTARVILGQALSIVTCGS